MLAPSNVETPDATVSTLDYLAYNSLDKEIGVALLSSQL